MTVDHVRNSVCGPASVGHSNMSRKLYIIIDVQTFGKECCGTHTQQQQQQHQQQDTMQY